VVAALAVVAADAQAWLAAAALGLGALLPPLHIVQQCMAAMAAVQEAVARLRDGDG